MSENLLVRIPADPQYVPDPINQQLALGIFASAVPLADETHCHVTDEIRFIDAGANQERTRCPICGTYVDENWWVQAVDAAYEKTRFADLTVTMRCCGNICSLNDLHYEWQIGFARFSLEARNPATDIEDGVIQSLEEVLRCRLRKIQAHY